MMIVCFLVFFMSLVIIAVMLSVGWWVIQCVKSSAPTAFNNSYSESGFIRNNWGKVGHWLEHRGRTAVGLRRGAHLPVIGRWARRWMDHWVCDAWPVRRQTYGYLPSRTVSPPFGRYHIILLGDGGTSVWTTCPELLLGSGLVGIPNPTVWPLSHQATPFKLETWNRCV